MMAVLKWLWGAAVRTGQRLSRPLMVLCSGALAGIILGDQLKWIAPWAWGGMTFLLLLALWRAEPSRLKLALAGMVTFAFLQCSAEHDPVRELLLSRNGHALNVEAVGYVRDEPQLDPSGRTWKFPLELETLQRQSCTESLLYVKLQSARAPQYGDRVAIRGSLQQAVPAQNPGEFDWAWYLHRQGFSAQLEVNSGSLVTVIERTGGNSVVRSSMEAREWIGQTVTADLEEDPEIAATVRTMVLGTQESTPQEIEDAFVDSGTMHVFAVSGLHVALFGLVLWQVLRLFRVPRTAVVFMIIPLMFFYVYVTGLRPSAWRAAFMASIILVGPLLNRNGNIFNSLGFAALVVLAFNTQQLFQAGFQLSFGVVFMLALLNRPILDRLERLYELEPYLPVGFHSRRELFSAWCRKKIVESTVVSFCATLGSAPLMLHHFGLLTPIGILSNLFLVTLSSLILATACLSLLCAGVKLTWLSLITNNANWAFTKLSIGLAEFFSNIPGGHFHMNSSHWFNDETARLTVLALRDGGGATHLDLGNQQWMLDAGSATGFLRTQRPFLLRYPVTKLDGMILSHRDADHSGAATAMAEAFSARQVFLPPSLPQFTQTSSEVHHALAGLTQSLRSGATFEILYPPPALAYGPADDQCLIVKFTIDGWKLLFTSDAGFIAEKWLLENHIDVSADVLMKGKHADDFSGIPEFLNAVHPQAICFSNQRYPMEQRVAKSWIDMVTRKGIPYLDQGTSGAVEISITPQGMTLKGFVDGKLLELQKAK